MRGYFKEFIINIKHSIVAGSVFAILVLGNTTALSDDLTDFERKDQESNPFVSIVKNYDLSDRVPEGNDYTKEFETALLFEYFPRERPNRLFHYNLTKWDSCSVYKAKNIGYKTGRDYRGN